MIFKNRLISILINMIFFVALSMLFVPCSIKLVALYFVVSCVIGYLFSKLDIKYKHPLLIVVAILYSISLAMSFKTKWIFFDGVHLVANMLGIDVTILLYLVGGILAFFGFFALASIFEFVYEKLSIKKINIEGEKTGTNYMVLVAAAFVIITLSTTCSFLYKYHTWGDSNIFFTIGKSMLSGIMPYRDLFDQKGPIVFMLHALAAMMSYKTFLGVYVFQLINCFFYLLFIYKTNCLLFKKNNYLNTIFLAVLTYTSIAYSSGDSVEEFSLAIIMYAIYVAVKNVVNKKIPSKFELIMIGVTSALIFWMKYTIIGFYLGWILIPMYSEIKNKQYKRLFINILYIILGVLITSGIIFIYFGMNGCLLIMLKSYFLDNMNDYSGGNLGILGSIYNIFFHGLTSILESNLILFILGIVGLCKLKNDNYLQSSLIAMFLSMIFTIYFGGRYLVYYCLIFSPFALFGLSYIANYLIDVLSIKINERIVQISYCALIVLCFVLSNNSMNQLNKPYEDYLNYQVISDIEDSGISEPTILYYGALEKGFHNTMGTLPNVKYYFVPNMMYEKLVPIQDEYIKDGLVDFVFTKEDKEYPGYHLLNKYEDKYYLFVKD